MRSPAQRFVATFLAFVVPFAVAVPFLAYTFEPLDGGLTRIGRWSERSFGWRSPQPRIPLAANGENFPTTDVLVLGDSFSRENIWQSFVTENIGLRFRSYHFGDVGCIDNWIRQITELPSSLGKTVVLEVVERAFIAHFRILRPCAATTPKAFELAPTTLVPNRGNYPITLDASYLFRTAWNEYRLLSAPDQIISGETVGARLRRSDLFSNRRSDWLLYYFDDALAHPEWSDQEIDAALLHLQDINDRIRKSGRRFVLIVVPDKSSVYRDYFARPPRESQYGQIIGQMAARGISAPDVLRYMKEQLPETKDLYYPNDTHFSPRGYQLLASLVEEVLKR